MFRLVRKRNGKTEAFSSEKIARAMFQALFAEGKADFSLAEQLAEKVVLRLPQKIAGEIPTVEEIQDVVEEVLMESGLPEVAKAYILYREKRRDLREAKRKLFGVEDDLKLSLNACRVLSERYLLRDGEGKIKETPGQMMERVARSIAEVDREYGEEPEESFNQFYQLLGSLSFLPNSPTLMNAGTPLGQLAACFVLPVEDDLASIFESVKKMALVHKSGGGTGFSFAHLRPRGDQVASTGGRASGPVSFMRVFDTATEVVKQGGKRRGANMGGLRFNHPDIREFVSIKSKPGLLENFNLSVAVTDEEMEKVRQGEEVGLVNPRDGRVWEKINARELLELMADRAWASGEPGLIFLDTVNRFNPTPSLGKIETTNPCGEVPLLAYESCNLGSINLSQMVQESKIDYPRLKETVWQAVHFLDNVIDASRYPLPEVENMTKSNRKIGLGVMGFVDMLVQIGVPYYSEAGLKIAEEVMHFISTQAYLASQKLAQKRGTFPNYPQSVWAKKNCPLRNATLTSIAPTGTISLIAHCSSGIEPYFALAYRRFVLENAELTEVNPYLERLFRERHLPSELWNEVLRRGKIGDIPGVPEDLKNLFLTSQEIPPEFQVRMQAAFQKYVDNGVSKTINLPENSTPEKVVSAFLLAHELGCKGITVYRYGSRASQVLYLGTEEGQCESC
ncbi:MAG: ribonucleoside-diphosphate reductase alpha chain [Candidatus Atribacteria bacterium]|nr:ribonucleoside-diphosphate reductase alpha chain [Candidatus Atribacteria bacterium]